MSGLFYSLSKEKEAPHENSCAHLGAANPEKFLYSNRFLQ